MAFFTGQSVQTLNTLQQVVQFSDQLPYYDKNASQLVKLLMKLKKRRSANVEFNWAEDDLLTRTTTINGAFTSTLRPLTYTVLDGTIFRVDDMVLNTRTFEQFIVNAQGATTVTLDNFGVTAATAGATLDKFLILSNSSKHGGLSRAIKMTGKTIKTNYLQEFKAPAQTNKELAAVELYGIPEREYQRLKAADELLKDKNYQYYFGEPKKTAVSNDVNPRYTTGGVKYWIDQANGAAAVLGTAVGRVMDMNGAMTQAGFESWLRACRRFSQSSNLWLFASGTFIEKIQQFGTIGHGVANSIPIERIVRNAETLGLNISAYDIYGMTVTIIEEKFFEDASFAAGKAEDIAFCLDLTMIEEMYGEGWDNVLSTNIQAPDSETFLDQYKALGGLQLRMGKQMGYAFNIV